MRWKRILTVGLAAAALALSLYVLSLAQAGFRTTQTSDTDRGAIGVLIAFDNQLEAHGTTDATSLFVHT
jgi:hypothetical protein